MSAIEKSHLFGIYNTEHVFWFVSGYAISTKYAQNGVVERSKIFHLIDLLHERVEFQERTFNWGLLLRYIYPDDNDGMSEIKKLIHLKDKLPLKKVDTMYSGFIESLPHTGNVINCLNELSDKLLINDVVSLQSLLSGFDIGYHLFNLQDSSYESYLTRQAQVAADLLKASLLPEYFNITNAIQSRFFSHSSTGVRFFIDNFF